MAEQIGHRWAPRALLLMLTMLGLVGMHGLPEAMAGSSGAAIMPTSAAMTPSLAALWGMTEPSPTRPGRSADSAPTEPGSSPAMGLSPRRINLAAAPMGCGMDHANCVAVLRGAGHLPPAGSIHGVVSARDLSWQAPVSGSASGPRAPPEVSLIALGISRT